MVFTVDVGLALTRPPKVHRVSRVHLDACCAHHAELDAVLMATRIHRAEMPVSSVVVDWPDD